MTEFELIERVFAPLAAADAAGVVLGVGDDGAVLAPPAGRDLVVVTDTMVAGRHFPKGMAPADIGYRALAVNVSDLAAMGSEPLWFQLALTLPAIDESWVRAFAAGLGEAASEYRLALIGGDVTRGPVTITVTAIGAVAPGAALTRAGARPGDAVFVSGRLGEAGLAIAADGGRIEAPGPDALGRWRGRLARPAARAALGARLVGIATAAIDVSDGLVQDLGHIARRSGVAIILEQAALPIADPGLPLAVEMALTGGDDYELTFTAAAADAARIGRLATPVPVTRIGRVEAGDPGVTVLAPEGHPLDLARGGYSHF